MGDCAELYWDMENDPHFWDGYDEEDDEYDFKISTSNKKKNLMVFVDAESVSSSCAYNMQKEISKRGECFEVRYYALQKDESTKGWKEVGKQYNYKPILLRGLPEKNKIDKKIIKDIKKVLSENKSIDIFCIASRDGDYEELVNYLKTNHKRAVVFAPKQTSKRLINASSETVYIPRKK